MNNKHRKQSQTIIKFEYPKYNFISHHLIVIYFLKIKKNNCESLR